MDKHNTTATEQRLKLLGKYYGLTKAALVVDSAGDNIKSLFRQRRLLIQERIDSVDRALDASDTSHELFDQAALDVVMSPEVDTLISNPLEDLPCP